MSACGHRAAAAHIQSVLLGLSRHTQCSRVHLHAPARGTLGRAAAAAHTRPGPAAATQSTRRRTGSAPCWLQIWHCCRCSPCTPARRPLGSGNSVVARAQQQLSAGTAPVRSLDKPGATQVQLQQLQVPGVHAATCARGPAYAVCAGHYAQHILARLRARCATGTVRTGSL